MATILVHPAMGERSFDDAHAKTLMAWVNNGGWEYKKPSVGAAKSPRFSKKDDAAANTSTNSGEVTVPEEEGDN